MNIARSSLETTIGPEDWFTGTVYMGAIGASTDASRVGAANVHVSPGARTAWHTHPHGQTMCVTEGVGRRQRRGGSVEELHPGDRVVFDPGEEHWHGAAPNRFMAHIAIQNVNDAGVSANWGAHVTDEEYTRQVA